MNQYRLRQHLVAALEKAMASQKPIRVPTGSEIYIKWFFDLARTRTGGMAGPNPITYSEMEAYFRLHRWPMEARHIDLIVALDQAWLAHVRGKQGQVPSTAQPVNAAAFDAVFG